MNLSTQCDDCASKKHCLWSNLNRPAQDRLMEITNLRAALPRNTRLFRASESLRSIFILRSGSVKAWNVTEEGEDYIIRFHMLGDVLGLGAISTGYYDCTATTLDTVSVCEIPFLQFQQLAEEIPSLNQQLLRMMSREIVRDEKLMLLKSNRSASSRLASFINGIAHNFGDRGYSKQDFNLTMGRRDIANYLGLALETVSRTLSQFEHEGTLHVNGKHIRLTNAERLSELSERH